MRFFKPLLVLYTAGSLCGLVHLLIQQWTKPEDHFHQFIYDRGPIQHVTLFTACFVVTLLLFRFFEHVWKTRQFTQTLAGTAQPPRELHEQLNAVEKSLADDGMPAAVVCADEVAQENAEVVRKAHETISHLTGALPVIGFLGTLLGLNQGLYVAFGSGAPKTEAVMKFVTAFATTLDNTILAVFCAVPLFAMGFMLGRAENGLLARYTAYVWKRFGLKRLPESDKTAEVVQGELSTLTARMAQEAETALAKIVERAAETCHDRMNRAIEEVFTVQRRHDKSLTTSIAAELTAQMGQSLGQIGEILKQQNHQLAEEIAAQVEQLAMKLPDHAPQEIVLHYQNNGHAK
jgi:hypothetical protein